MNRPLMPKATALWLMNHTCLTLDQIGQFCGFHPLEVSVLAETEFLQELDPIFNEQLTQEEISRCEEDVEAQLQLNTPEFLENKTQKRYTPLSKRGDIPGAVLWLIRHYPHMSDHGICSLLSTTKVMVRKIREGKYWNSKNLVPKDPVVFRFCSLEELQRVVGVENVE